jgi:oxygen-independent coproporphyrinogen III oxidase
MNPAHAKYLSEAVPRYTSYPTVPRFSDAVDSAVYADWLSRLDPSEPISLYLHVPFCRQLCWYCGCNMKLASRDAPVAQYADTLRREIALLAARLPARMSISHLHWGGGTPTALTPDDLECTMDAVRAQFDFAPEAEVAIESDPRTLSEDMIARIGAIGFNRASFGVQEFDPRVQAAINRIQPPEMVARSVEGLRAAGVGNINFDLIYGLPFQTVDTLIGTIGLCAAMRPDRIALFGYAHVPWMAKKQRLIPTEALPGAEERLAQAHRAAQELARLGYAPVGLDHFALPDDGLSIAAANGKLRRNFQGNTTDQARTLMGVGSTSIGRTPEGFIQNIGETGAWARAVEAGILPVAKGHSLTEDDHLRGQIIEQLMCFGAVDLPAVMQRCSVGAPVLAAELEELSEFARDDVVTLESGRARVNDDAKSLVRTVAAVFDAYRGRGAAQHSVAV